VEAGVRLDDPRVSAHHATAASSKTGALSIADAGSKNGTFVNGVRIERSTLELGDVISVGDTCLVVAEEPSEPSADASYNLLGDSAEIRRIRERVGALGPSELTVLLLGESGCGKEVVARALHAASGRSGDFVAVNCAAVPENLFESQFFGHKAGAFTGAVAHVGYFQAAAQGTLFLDEVGELPISQQPKLLRAIQERAIVPLGTTRPIASPVRIVAATNRDLAGAVSRGEFRADLFARLFETRVHLPPLRERREDVLELFTHAFGSQTSLSHAVAEALLLHRWPFNVRELFAAAREAALHWAPGTRLDAPDLRARFRSQPPELASDATTDAAARGEPPRTLESDELRTLLGKHRGNVAEVARAVGRSRRQVYRWLQKYGLDVDSFRS
jgi:DNA-binding NtrC family response regulator